MYKPYDSLLDKIAYVAGIIILSLLFALLCLYLFFDFDISKHIRPCMLNKLTGLYCPGCGGTRAVYALLSGQIIKSIYYNPIVAYAFFPGLWFMISQTIYRIKPSANSGKLSGWFHTATIKPLYIYLGIILLLLNCAIKNFVLLYFKTALI